MKNILVCALSAGLVLALGLPMVFSKQAEKSDAVATTIEVQEFDHLLFELKQLQNQAAGFDRAAYKSKVLGRTSRFLEQESAPAAKFAELVDGALSALRHGRLELEQANHQATNRSASAAVRQTIWKRYQTAQARASSQLLGGLRDTPRHRLFKEKQLLWLLRLDYSLAALR